MGRGVPLCSRLRGLGEHRELPRRKRFWGVACEILCNFTHLLVHLTSVWKWEIPTYLDCLVGLIIPL